MKKPAAVKVNSRIRLDASPHFILEATFAFDSEDEDHEWLLNKEKCVVMRFRYHELHLGDIREHDFRVQLKGTPSDMMRAGIFIALSHLLKESYEWLEGEEPRDATQERFLVDTIGFCNLHTYRKILRSEWMQEHTEEEIEVRVSGKEGVRILKGQDICDERGEKIGELELFYFSKCESFADYLEKVRQI